MKCQALKCFEPPGEIICVEEREEMFPQMSVVFIVKLPVSGDLCFWPRVGKLADIPRLPEGNGSWVIPCLWHVRPKG